MEATTKVNIQSLEPYRHLFPAARAVDKTVKKGADVSDTVSFIPEIVLKTQWQVKDFVNQELRGLSTYEACKKLWYFVKTHIRYKKDERGVEQVRSPRRLIHDGEGDCDCFTTFIDTCLAALGIPFINRITKYKENYFQHIYPIVPLDNGRYITMDCVVDRFNYEEPYSEKKDFKMDLQYLDGIEEAGSKNAPRSMDAQDLFGNDDDLKELGKLFKRNQSTSAMPEENQGSGSKRKGLQRLKRVLNVVNKANPATVLLRAGILASMKLNIFKVAQRLKWAYLHPEQAKAKGADMNKLGHLQKVLYKMEQVFYSAGGKPENLKKAILTGRGNRNKEVSGIDGNYDTEMAGMDENTPLPTLLGDIYHDEFVNGLEGTEGLGVVQAAAITAATGIMGTIAGLLKKIGNLFPNAKNGAGADFENVDTPDAASSNSNSTSPPDDGSTTAPLPPANAGSSSLVDSGNASNTNGTDKEDDSDKNKVDKPTGLKAFWENNKSWMKPVGITTAIAGVLYGGYKLIKRSKQPETKPAVSLPAPALSGTKKKKKGKAAQHPKKSSIALM